MDLDEYTQLLEAPLSVDADAIQPLRDLLSYAPYCVSARLLLLKALYDNGQRPEAIRTMPRAILSAPQEVSVYFLLNPKKIKRSSALYKVAKEAEVAEEATATTKASRKAQDKFVGEREMSYFELIDRMHQVAEKTGISFEELAKRYLEARQFTRQS